MTAREANFDGLVGPTHNYAGLSLGNLASQNNLGEVSNPRAAALQGLSKMRQLAQWGFWQGVLPPAERPDITTLRRLGFSGSDQAVLQAAAGEPTLLAACASASCMWAANAATVSPSADTADGRVHFTPANLHYQWHRSLETEGTARALQRIFPASECFAHHAALPSHALFGDEGAANHSRLSADYAAAGVELFVFGRAATGAGSPQRYPARQSQWASQAVARRHGLAPDRTVFAQQNPELIDAGVFHNDVIAVSNLGLLFCHQQAFVNQMSVYAHLEQALPPGVLHILEVPSDAVAVTEAVSSYLFNSQLLAAPDGVGHWLIAPQECAQSQAVNAYLQALGEASGIRQLHFFDLRESMRNGGGPACLRLRVVLTERERAAVHSGVWLDSALADALESWINRHYRDRLAPTDLADPQLLHESRTALDELTALLRLGSLYEFQQ